MKDETQNLIKPMYKNVKQTVKVNNTNISLSDRFECNLRVRQEDALTAYMSIM